MQYIADTAAIIRHFSKTGKIGQSAKRILRDADKGENTIFVSIISMVEILYLSERNRIPLNFGEIKIKLLQLDNYGIIELDLDIVEAAKSVQGLELHDRLIVSTALSMNIPILTSDKMIEESGVVSVIW